MKKTTYVTIVSCVLALLLTACSGGGIKVPGTEKSDSDNESKAVITNPQDTEPEEPQTDPAETTPQDPKSVKVSEQVVYNENSVKVTVKSLDYNDNSDALLRLFVSNSGQKDVNLYFKYVSFNGIAVSSDICDGMVYFTGISSVPAGKAMNGEIKLADADMERMGISIIKDIELCTTIRDEESFASIDEFTANIQTSADPSFVQEYDDSGVVLLDQSGYKVVLKKLSRSLTPVNSFGSGVYLYAENNTETNVRISIGNFYVGEKTYRADVNTYSNYQIPAHKKAFYLIDIPDIYFTDNGFTDITKLGLDFVIVSDENNTITKILDSGKVTAEFN